MGHYFGFLDVLHDLVFLKLKFKTVYRYGKKN